MVKVSTFDAVDYLDSEEMIAEYLAAAEEDGDPAVLRTALDNVTRARECISRHSDNKKN